MNINQLTNAYMGVTIAFKGRLKSPNLIPALVAEVEDICKTNDWKYKIIGDNTSEPPPLSHNLQPKPFTLDEEEEHDFEWGENNEEHSNFGLTGISFQPHKESESIELLFDTEGVLRSIFSMLISESSRNKFRWIFVKTQFAGIETHIRVINLLTYLRKQYFSSLIIKDEGGYYPKKDITTLTTRMDFIDNAIATMKDVFENGDFSGSPDDVLERIQTALSQSFKGLNIKIIKIDTDDFPEDLKQKYLDDIDEEYRQKRKREDWDDDELPF